MSLIVRSSRPPPQAPIKRRYNAAHIARAPFTEIVSSRTRS